MIEMIPIAALETGADLIGRESVALILCESVERRERSINKFIFNFASQKGINEATRTIIFYGFGKRVFMSEACAFALTAIFKNPTKNPMGVVLSSAVDTGATLITTAALSTVLSPVPAFILGGATGHTLNYYTRKKVSSLSKGFLYSIKELYWTPKLEIENNLDEWEMVDKENLTTKTVNISSVEKNIMPTQARITHAQQLALKRSINTSLALEKQTQDFKVQWRPKPDN